MQRSKQGPASADEGTVTTPTANVASPASPDNRMAFITRATPMPVSTFQPVVAVRGAAGEATLSVITLMQAGLPEASARSMADGRAAIVSTISP